MVAWSYKLAKRQLGQAEGDPQLEKPSQKESRGRERIETYFLRQTKPRTSTTRPIVSATAMMIKMDEPAKCNHIREWAKLD